MKKITTATAVSIALSFSAPQALAANQWECGIWMCAPVGFALPGCEKSFKAMLKRVSKLKSPTPSWHKCIVDEKQVESDSYREAGVVPDEVGSVGAVATARSAKHGYVHTNPFTQERFTSDRKCIDYSLIGNKCSTEMFIHVEGEGLESEPFTFDMEGTTDADFSDVEIDENDAE